MTAARPPARSLAETGELFGGDVPERLRQKGSFTTTLMNQAAEDATPDLDRVGGVLAEAFGLPAALAKPDVRREARAPAGPRANHGQGRLVNVSGRLQAEHSGAARVTSWTRRAGRPRQARRSSGGRGLSCAGKHAS